MNENIMLMRRAKNLLSGHWGNAALASLIYLAIMAVSSSTSIVEFVIFGPLYFGYILYLACLVDRKESNFSLLFNGFNRFVETLLAGIIYSLAVGIGLTLLIVPGVILACGLSMTFYIMLDEPEISGIEAIKKSWHMMQGHKANYFYLQLRFFGWYLISIITLGIAFIWISPYITVTNLNFYRSLRYGTY